MKKFFIPIFFCSFAVFLAGCAKLAHLEELLRLKELSDDRDRQDQYREKQDQYFERLLTALKNDSLNRFTDRRSFLQAFGPPIFARSVRHPDGQTTEQWLYRYTTRPFDSPKVYCYFSPDGKLADYRYFPRETQMAVEATKTQTVEKR